jgi:hypothetical protein
MKKKMSNIFCEIQMKLNIFEKNGRELTDKIIKMTFVLVI